MNKEQSVLLRLIKQSQFGFSTTIDFAGVDIDSLFNEAMQQSVLGIVAPEIPTQYSNVKWHEAQNRIKASYIRYCFAQDDLKSVLNEACIPFVILKGNASAMYYLVPSRRSMGDIDFLVPQDLYIRTKEVLRLHGYVEKHDNGRHASFIKNGFLFEIHHHFSHDVDIEEYLVDGLKSNEYVIVEGHEFPILPKLANGLVLLDHLRRHLISAVGIRHLVDWMMYVNRLLDDDFWYKTFLPVAQTKKLDKLAIVATRTCQIYLGLSESITWCFNAEEQNCELLMDLVLQSGNFGIKTNKGKKVESLSVNIKRYGFFSLLQTVGEKNWKAYHKYKWLKPLCWIYQLFRYVFRGFRFGVYNTSLKDDFERSRKRYYLLRELDIE